jgi:flagellar FliJ protein
MAQSSAFDTLIELATIETDEATKRLGLAVRAGDEAEQKLALLLQYREDYATRFRTSLASGLTAAGCRNFQLFLAKLDEAIDGQQKIVQQAHKRVGNERGAWQGCERKRMSYDLLATRAMKQQQLKDVRREQKQTDEYAARRLFYKS